MLAPEVFYASIEARLTRGLQAILATFHSIRDSNGKRLAGPPWAWPNGNVIDKFLFGYKRSAEWRRYGAVYRIWACLTPEV